MAKGNFPNVFRSDFGEETEARRAGGLAAFVEFARACGGLNFGEGVVGGGGNEAEAEGACAPVAGEELGGHWHWQQL